MDLTSSLLDGVDHLLIEGCAPGRIVVFGRSAEAVLTAADEGEVIVAAAELGLGRIVVASHKRFGEYFRTSNQVLLPNQSGEAEDKCSRKGSSEEVPSGKGDPRQMGRFQENVKQWLAIERGNIEPSSVGKVDQDVALDSLGCYKILFWNGLKAELSEEKLSEFIKAGGGFFHSVTPWNWINKNTGKTLYDLPYWNLLLEAGLCYTDDQISPPTPHPIYTVAGNRADQAHLKKVLKAAALDMCKAAERGIVRKLLVQLPREAIVQLEPQLNDLWHSCNAEASENPVTRGEEAKGKAQCGCLHLWLTCVEVLGLTDVKAPGIRFFPMDLDTTPPLTCTTLEFNGTGTDFHFTGCYAIAGTSVKVAVDSGNGAKEKWRLMIGCHTDRLSDETLKRWPTLVTQKELNDDITLISSSFGGSVYLLSPEMPCDLKVTLEGVVETPRFSLEEGEAGRIAWKTRRLSPGLWADISGKFVTITLPSSAVRDLDDPSDVMNDFDDLVVAYHDLRGSDVKKDRRQWIVPDRQPSVGYMHAGYPVVTQMDVADEKSKLFLANVDKLRKTDTGSWGIFHEIGHNMQRDEWTFDGTVEVTVNIFSLYANERFCGEKPWQCHWLRNQLNGAERYLAKGTSFEDWKNDPGVALMIYAQLVRDFGWESYRKVFRHYETLPGGEKPTIDQDKIDHWFGIFSEIVEFNLTPLVMFWGIPLSRDAVTKLAKSGLSYFLPDDELTKAASSRTELVISKFSPIVRTV